MYEQAFRNIDDSLWKDAGCGNELDYIEQTSWILFLKYLDDYETDKELAAKLDGKTYNRIINGEYRWTSWAAPKKKGKIDLNIALTGKDLLDFVNLKLFPYLREFKDVSNDSRRITYKIGEIFGELNNKIQSGYTLREIIDIVDDLKFLSNENKHELSSLYEDKIYNMGNAGRNGGEYYTPRPLIRAIVKIINPKVGETVYDGAIGSAGFLCEAYNWMKNQNLTTKEYKILQNKTFFGQEKKSLAYIVGIMNMILHGIETPNIVHDNTLTENSAEILQKDKVDIVLANPPFGGKERQEIQQNFLIKTSETAYLFLQHFIKKLKKGGRCGIVIKNTFLSNTDNASIALRKQLLDECDLFAILDLPNKIFLGSGVKTVVLFFEKGKPTKDIWYYQLDAGRNLGKTNPLNDSDLADFVRQVISRKQTKNSWIINYENIDTNTWDLSVSNPNKKDVVDMRTPEIIINEINKLEQQSMKSLQTLRRLL